MGLYAAWQGMKDVAGSRDAAMMGLKKAFGTYNFAEDPEYQRDMQLLSQNPTNQALEGFHHKWNKYLDGQTLQDVAQGLSYAENTPQWYENEMLKNKYGMSEIDSEKYPEFTALELGMAQNQKALSDNEVYYAPKFSNQRYKQNNQALINGQQSISENNIRLKYLEPQLKEQLTAAEVANDIRNLDYQYKIESDPIKMQLLENDLTLANETLQDKIAMSGLQIDNSKENLKQNEVATRVAQGTEKATINSAIQQSYMDALRTELMDKTMPAQVAAPYINNSGRILANNNQVTQNRILNETAGNMITQSDLETELLRLQNKNAQDEFNFMQGLDGNTRYGINTGGNNGPAIEIKERLPDVEGIPPLGLNAADTVVYLSTGDPYKDAEGNQYVAQSDFMGNNRVFKPVPPDTWLSGGTKRPGDFRKTGTEETGGGQTQSQGVQQNPESLLQKFKEVEQSKTGSIPTANQIKGKVSLIPDEKFQALYGMSKLAFIDYLNRF